MEELAGPGRAPAGGDGEGTVRGGGGNADPETGGAGLEHRRAAVSEVDDVVRGRSGEARALDEEFGARQAPGVAERGDAGRSGFRGVRRCVGQFQDGEAGRREDGLGLFGAGRFLDPGELRFRGVEGCRTLRVLEDMGPGPRAPAGDAARRWCAGWWGRG